MRDDGLGATAQHRHGIIPQERTQIRAPVPSGFAYEHHTAGVAHGLAEFEPVQQLVEPEALFESFDRLARAPHLQRVLMVLVRRLRPVVAFDERRVGAAAQERRGGGM